MLHVLCILEAAAIYVLCKGLLTNRITFAELQGLVKGKQISGLAYVCQEME